MGRTEVKFASRTAQVERKSLRLDVRNIVIRLFKERPGDMDRASELHSETNLVGPLQFRNSVFRWREDVSLRFVQQSSASAQTDSAYC